MKHRMEGRAIQALKLAGNARYAMEVAVTMMARGVEEVRAERGWDEKKGYHSVADAISAAALNANDLAARLKVLKEKVR